MMAEFVVANYRLPSQLDTSLQWGALEVPAAGRKTVGSTTFLISDKTKKSQRSYLYPWPFFHEHLEKGESNKWKFKFDRRKQEKNYDLERIFL